MKVLVLVFFFLPGLAQGVRAANFTLEPEADARIINIPGSGYRPVNYARDFLSVYTASGNVQRTLMRFNFDGVTIASGERVVSASLSLQVSTEYGNSRGRATEIYRVTRAWTETGLSWLAPEKNLLWNPEGGEYVGRSGFPDLSPYASNSETPAHGQRISWDITTLVDEWVEGAEPNEGLLMRSYNGNGLTFASREGVAMAHPQLVITTGPGVPRLRVEQSGARQIKLSWRGTNVAVIEENTLPSNGNWHASENLTPSLANGRTEVLLPALATVKFYRLRSPSSFR